jgi:hypothetical protein
MTSFVFRGLLLLAVAGALAGCAGYRLGNVSGRTLQGVHNVYVPTVRNASLEADIQMVTTNAIIRRFESDGTLETSQNPQADSELDVVITDVQLQPLRSSSNDVLLTAQYQLTIEGRATYVNRRLGRKVFDNTPVQGVTTFFAQADLNEAERQALPLACQDFANQTVQLVTEGW